MNVGAFCGILYKMSECTLYPAIIHIQSIILTLTLNTIQFIQILLLSFSFLFFLFVLQKDLVFYHLILQFVYVLLISRIYSSFVYNNYRNIISINHHHLIQFISPSHSNIQTTTNTLFYLWYNWKN